MTNHTSLGEILMKYRAEIDDLKAERLANPWKAGSLEVMKKESAFRFLLEQLADAELYIEHLKEIEKEHNN